MASQDKHHYKIRTGKTQLNILDFTSYLANDSDICETSHYSRSSSVMIGLSRHTYQYADEEPLCKKTFFVPIYPSYTVL